VVSWKGCSNFLLHLQYNRTAMFSLRSSLRRKLLTFFYVNRSARVYVRQLANALQVDSTNLSRELKQMEREGLVTSEIEGRQLYYTLNRTSPNLKALFQLLQGSIGVIPALKDALASVSGIASASLYGSFAKGEADAASDVDVLIIGSPDQGSLATQLRSAEGAIHREINYTVLSPRELQKRLNAGDPFIADVWHGKRVELIDGNGNPAPENRSQTGAPLSRRRTQQGRSRS
jgi:predicted nucleotidyltransferase